ncbi:hypothetical protein Hanom_Chr12g01119841 [Helianthus anomalus]
MRLIHSLFRLQLFLQGLFPRHLSQPRLLFSLPLLLFFPLPLLLFSFSFLFYPLPLFFFPSLLFRNPLFLLLSLTILLHFSLRLSSLSRI